MRTTTTPPAQSKTPSNYPALSYSTALQFHFVTSQGEVTQIADCSESEFATLIEEAIEAYSQTEHASLTRIHECCTELAALDYAEALSRWFALLMLQEYHIPVALFSTSEDAYASVRQEMLS